VPDSTFAVRTLFLANFFEPAADLAEQRRQATRDPKALVAAMKRAELADQTLERELNGFAEKGFDLVTLINHPHDERHPYDLLITAIFARPHPPTGR
jgi:hypothetical protein